MSEWEATCAPRRRHGLPGCTTTHAAEIMDEIAAVTPTFAGVTAKLDEVGSIQWPMQRPDHDGTPIMHRGGFVRGKGRFMETPYVATAEGAPPLPS